MGFLGSTVSAELYQWMSVHTEDDVWDEEQGGCNVVLIASEAEVLVHAFDFCIADVCTVNVREEVQHCHDGDKTHVDLGCVSAVS